jgi:putative porin
MVRTTLSRAILSAAVIALFLSPISILAEDSNALLDLLVRKKLITREEAAEVQAELTKEEEVKENSVGKLKLSTPLTELELYGDARLRYEIRSGENGNNDTLQRNRERYRLRLGLRGTLTDDWFFGVRLETGASPRSSNVTLGDDTSGSATTANNGPFSKVSDSINVGQAYLGYRGFKDITLTVGKMPNPLVTTFMVWDADINPEGAAEQWKHTFTFSSGGESTEESYNKDGMALPKEKKSEASTLKLDLFVNLAQFVYDDANPENPIGPSPSRIPNTDAFLLAWQVGAKFTFPNKLYAQIAPTIYNYTGAGDTFNTTFSGESGGNQTGVNNLLVFDLPMEVGWKLGEIPIRFFADFAVNLAADDRAAAAGHPDKGDQRYAYQVGLSVGQLKKKREWQLNVFWQRQDQYSLDPNLVDTEFFDTKLNLEGVGVTFGYMLSDAVWVQLLYGYAWRADGSLGTAGAGDIAINPLETFQLFQADLNVRF